MINDVLTNKGANVLNMDSVRHLSYSFPNRLKRDKDQCHGIITASKMRLSDASSQLLLSNIMLRSDSTAALRISGVYEECMRRVCRVYAGCMPRLWEGYGKAMKGLCEPYVQAIEGLYQVAEQVMTRLCDINTPSYAHPSHPYAQPKSSKYKKCNRADRGEIRIKMMGHSSVNQPTTTF